MATSAPPVAPSPSKELLVDDVYPEIVLRLPADRPKLLYRFAAVCKAWRRCLADPAFLRRYRKFHGLPHMIGYLHDGRKYRQFDPPLARFVSTSTTPFSARVPENGVGLRILDSRHGLVLFENFAERVGEASSLIVWDPVADHHEVVPLPEAFLLDAMFGSAFNFTAAVFCDSPGCDHLRCHGGPFRVVLLGIQGEKDHWGTSAFIYASASDSWTASPAAAAAVADKDHWGLDTAPATLVGSTLYFSTTGTRILRYEFGDEVEHLSYVDIPPFATQDARGTVLMPAADGRLSLAAMSDGTGDMRIHFWETEVRADGVVDWVHIQNAPVNIPVPGVQLIGVAASSLFILTEGHGIISIDMGSGRFQKVPQPHPGATAISFLVPVMSFRGPSDGEKSGSIEVPGPHYADAVPASHGNNSNDAKQHDNASSQILTS